MQTPSELEALASSRTTSFPKQTVVTESNPNQGWLSRPDKVMAALVGAALSTSGAADALNLFGRAAGKLAPYQRHWLRSTDWYRIGPPRVRPMTTKQRKKRLAKIARRSRQANRRRGH